MVEKCLAHVEDGRRGPATTACEKVNLRGVPSGGTCSGNLYLTSAIGRFNSDLHSEFMQASEVAPHQAMFLVGSGWRSIFGIGLSALKHLVHSNQDGMSHSHDRSSPTNAWRQPVKTRLEDGTILQGRRPRALRESPGAIGSPWCNGCPATCRRFGCFQGTHRPRTPVVPAKEKAPSKSRSPPVRPRPRPA